MKNQESEKPKEENESEITSIQMKFPNGHVIEILATPEDSKTNVKTNINPN